jgi:hypothetical protein
MPELQVRIEVAGASHRDLPGQVHTRSSLGTRGVYARYMQLLAGACTRLVPGDDPRGYLLAIFPSPGVPFEVPVLLQGLDRARAAERSWKVRASAAARHQSSCRPQQGARDQGWRTDPQRAACGRRAPDQADLCRGGDAAARASTALPWSWSAWQREHPPGQPPRSARELSQQARS